MIAGVPVGQARHIYRAQVALIGFGLADSHLSSLVSLTNGGPCRMILKKIWKERQYPFGLTGPRVIKICPLDTQSYDRRWPPSLTRSKGHVHP